MNTYNTFGRRFCAAIIDEVVLIIALYFIALPFDESGKVGFFSSSALEMLLYAGYFIFLHGKYGQTFGKNISGIKVINLDESGPIGYFNAIKREGLLFSVQLAGLFYFIFFNDTLGEPSIHAYNDFTLYTGLAWILVELVTMMLNPKRRALHDYLGGSVVIRTTA